MAYNFNDIEKKWNSKWEENAIYETNTLTDKQKLYLLVEFPYPSGAGLHVGHVRSYTAMDIIARKKRAEGLEVLFPIGWDAFGLPAENYAIKTGIHPSISTKENIDTFRKQLKACGFSFDWSREIDTTDPKYYKWSQWIFLKLYEKGLAYKKMMPVNWCPKDKCVLANEEVVSGKCERCSTDVIKKDKDQWMLAITKYAERLDKDLDETEYLEKIKIQQRNWIGISSGSEIDFEVKGGGYENKFSIFTTRADTLFGCTYCVLAPEHPLVEELVSKNILTNTEEVKSYRETSKQKLDIDRSAEGKEKTGIKLLGIVAINPGSKEEIPLFVADYVLPHYGTGAVMGVPAHDERDLDFAKKFEISIKEVISSHTILLGESTEKEGVETIVRKVVDPVLRDEDGNFYFIKEKNTGHIHFAGGTVDEDESEEEALRREIEEETGFTDFVIKKKIPITSTVWGYRYTKEKNQRSTGTAFEVVLTSLNRVKSEVDEGHHELVSFKKEEVYNAISWPHHKEIFSFYLSDSEVYKDDGVLINSKEFNGMESVQARKFITEAVGGRMVTKSKLRDWVFARQRYWGEPIPIVYDQNGKMFPVAINELPVLLPKVEKYEPTEDGQSPLSAVSDWVNVRGMINETGHFIKNDAGDIYKRETDTMPQWAGSSWYFIRYIDPHNEVEICHKELISKWLPVDWYNGGMEHTTLHLLYSRFWYKFLYDIGVVTSSEPYLKRTSQGMILGDAGVKMSKSLGNTVNPDDIVNNYGADVLRLYEMFIGPFDQAVVWDDKAIMGAKRFLDRVHRYGMSLSNSGYDAKTAITHKTVKAVTEGIENMSFNTCVSSLMIWLNESEKAKNDIANFKIFLKLLSPFAPFLTEELWEKVGEKESIHEMPWPTFNDTTVANGMVSISVQMNGKFKGKLLVEIDSTKEMIIYKVESHDVLKKFLEGKDVVNIVFVQNKIINFLLKKIENKVSIQAPKEI